MLAIWLEDGRLSVRENVPIPEPARGEALVRVLCAGICSTDLELTRGYYDYRGIPGHEFVGVVEQGPAGLVGARVLGEINAVCRKCATCRAGRSAHCPNRTVLGIRGRDGAFAEYLTLPVENFHLVPAELSNEVAVFVEPLAAALEVQQQVSVSAEDRVVVIGDGRLGQLVARTLALTGCRLLVAGRHRRKLDLLAASGIDVTLDGVPEERAFDIAVECTGNRQGIALALRALRPRGTLVMKSTYAGTLTLQPSAIVVDEITVVGSRCGPFAPAIGLLRERRIDVWPLVDGRYPLAEGIAAFEHAERPGVLKVILEISGERSAESKERSAESKERRAESKERKADSG